MRIVFYIIILIFPISLLAQSKEVRIYYDDEREILKEKYFVKDLDPSILYGTYESYYMSGSLKSKGNYINNETIGQWKYFYESGSVKMKGQLENNSNHGLWTYYFENGNKRMQGEIYDGLRQGEWLFFYETGELKSKGEYVDDVKNGLWNYYYEDELLKAQAIYKMGDGVYKEFYPSQSLKMRGYLKDEKSDSLWTVYYEDGSIKAEGNYKEGAKAGSWKYYYPTGLISSEGNYEKNLSNGKWTYYHPNGKIKAEGAERDGQKEGYWKLYYNDGQLKGEGIYEAGSGDYKEFYESGKLKVKGTIIEGDNHGEWLYYYETGELEGKATFEKGQGVYEGYYPDGSLKMKGSIKNGNKIGTWELYDKEGKLAGYFKPVYEDYEPILAQTTGRENFNENITLYNKPEYRYKSKGPSYFKARNNDFPTLVLQVNPFNMLFGDLQVSLEYNVQERIGYELLVHTYRNPFFINSNNLNAGDDFFRGMGVSFRQRFYHKDTPWGMPYFGHSISYTHINRFEEYSLANAETTATARMKQEGFKYGWLVGTRVLQNLNDRGFTFDINAGLNLCYYKYGAIHNSNGNIPVFESVTNQNIKLQPIVGLSFGYVFNIKKVNTLNP